MKRVAIVGAGLGGAVLAGALAKSHRVTLFEKGRGFGGRMSTRMAAPFQFDHGAQYFTIKDLRFSRLMQPLLDNGSVAEWRGDEAVFRDGMLAGVETPRAQRFVGVPGMAAMVANLAGGVEMRPGTDIAMLGERDASGWVLRSVDDTPLGTFDLVLATATPRQTLGLFGEHVPEAHPMRSHTMLPCYALMLGWDRPWRENWVSARLEGGQIAFVGVDCTKPGRNRGQTALVVHTTPRFASLLLDLQPDEIAVRIKAALLAETGVDASDAAHAVVHRWKSARVEHEAASAPWFDPHLGLGATGDWVARSRVEDVALAALDLADAVQAV